MSEQQIQKVRVTRLAHVGLWASDVAAQTRDLLVVDVVDLLDAEGADLAMRAARPPVHVSQGSPAGPAG